MGQWTGALLGGSSATSCALTTTWPLATLPRVPEYWRATPTELRPCLGRPVSSSSSQPCGGLCATKAVTRCWSSAWGSQAASVKRYCQHAVEVPATAAALVSQFFRSRSVSRPVRERSTLARLVARRNSGAKGAREVASSGRTSGLAFGTTGIFIGDTTTSRSLRGNTAEVLMRINIPQS